jgi:hypothetical protein
MARKKVMDTGNANTGTTLDIPKPKRTYARKKNTAPVEDAPNQVLIGNAVDGLLRMTNVESLRLGKLDAEVQKLQQVICGIDQAVTISEMQIRDQIRGLEETLKNFKDRKAEEKKGTIALFNNKHAEYKTEVSAIANKYNLDIGKFTYDPDTGVLRDLRT